MNSVFSIGVRILVVCVLCAGVAPMVQAQEPSDRDREAILFDLQRQLRALSVQQQSEMAHKQMLEVKYAEAKSRIDKLRAANEDYAAQHDRAGISTVSFDEVLRSLQTQRVQLSIELAGLEARREAMMAQRAQWSGEHDPARAQIQTALADLLAAQEQNVRRLQSLQEKGFVPESDIQVAKEKLLEAQIRMAEASHGGQSERQQQLENELLHLSLTRAETSARLNKIQELLQEFTHARASLDAYRTGQDELRSLEMAAERMDEERRALEHGIMSLKVKLDQIESEMELYRKEKPSEGSGG